MFDGEKTPSELALLIQKESIAYVFSCIGMKTQEQRLIEIFASIPEDFPIVGLGVGSSFDYLLGLQKRAPLLFQKLGLEWLYRLVTNPRARWGRIVDAFWRFPRVVKNSVKD
ncbi:MAG: WecB/TagA/CpsF family glycosyltransferase [Patescibacteria group bacterium]